MSNLTKKWIIIYHYYYFIFYFQLVTHERDMLKKDVKKISMERDSAYKHLTITSGIFGNIYFKIIYHLILFCINKMVFVEHFKHSRKAQ